MDQGVQPMKSILHFVGFRGEEYRHATKIFGLPDMVHRFLDPRAVAEFAKGDTVVYANGAEDKFHRYSFNDSEHF